ncbi:BTB/POZ domain-containing protein 6 [Aphelenchoides avenae]|nr:BTB/POZ domain-containing protein 6 [Aphelenchus avenae]
MSAPSLKDRIGSLLGDTTTADVTFVVGAERERICAHSQVMATASDSFKAMFFGDFNHERMVEIPDASPDGFRALMKYIYMDEMDISEDNVESVIQLANKYLLTGFLEECVEWLARNLTAASVYRFLPLGELYKAVGEV